MSSIERAANLDHHQLVELGWKGFLQIQPRACVKLEVLRRKENDQSLLGGKPFPGDWNGTCFAVKKEVEHCLR